MPAANRSVRSRPRPPTFVARGSRKRPAESISLQASTIRTHSGSPVLPKALICNGANASKAASARTIKPSDPCSPIRASLLTLVLTLTSRTARLGVPLVGRFRSPGFLQAMTGARVQLQAVEFLKLLDLIERSLAERGLAIKSV